MSVLAALGLLDLAGAARAAFRGRRYSSSSCAAVLTPMPGTPGTLSIEVAAQRLHVDHLLRADAELLDRPRDVDRACPSSCRTSTRSAPTSCIRSLSEETMVTSPPASLGLPRIGGDDVVGLVALLLDAGQVEGARRLRGSARTAGPGPPAARGRLRLVVGVDLVAEGLRRIVEDHREMGRRRRRPRCRARPASASTACCRSRTPRRPAARRTCASAAAGRGRRGR